MNAENPNSEAQKPIKIRKSRKPVKTQLINWELLKYRSFQRFPKRLLVKAILIGIVLLLLYVGACSIRSDYNKRLLSLQTTIESYKKAIDTRFKEIDIILAGRANIDNNLQTRIDQVNESLDKTARLTTGRLESTESILAQKLDSKQGADMLATTTRIMSEVSLQILNLQTDLNTLKAKPSALPYDDSILRNRIASMEGTISAIRDTVGDLKSTVSDIATRPAYTAPPVYAYREGYLANEDATWFLYSSFTFVAETIKPNITYIIDKVRLSLYRTDSTAYGQLKIGIKAVQPNGYSPVADWLTMATVNISSLPIGAYFLTDYDLPDVILQLNTTYLLVVEATPGLSLNLVGIRYATNGTAPGVMVHNRNEAGASQVNSGSDLIYEIITRQ